jgi:hypothetical protein
LGKHRSTLRPHIFCASHKPKHHVCKWLVSCKLCLDGGHIIPKCGDVCIKQYDDWYRVLPVSLVGHSLYVVIPLTIVPTLTICECFGDLIKPAICPCYGPCNSGDAFVKSPNSTPLVVDRVLNCQAQVRSSSSVRLCALCGECLAPRRNVGNSTSSNCNLSADSYARKAHVCRGRTGGIQ